MVHKRLHLGAQAASSWGTSGFILGHKPPNKTDKAHKEFCSIKFLLHLRRFFLLRTKKTRGGPEKPVKKPPAVPPQCCAHARQAHFAPTIAFFVVDPPSASGPCVLRERGGSPGSQCGHPPLATYCTAGFTGLLVLCEMSENGCSKCGASRTAVTHGCGFRPQEACKASKWLERAVWDVKDMQHLSGRGPRCGCPNGTRVT